MVKPAARRDAAGHAIKRYGVSVRRACGLAGCRTSTYYYEGAGQEDEALRAALKEKALEHPRWGYRNLQTLLQREGWRDNHKRIYRIYAQEGLQVSRRRKRAKARYRGVELEVPTRLNELWVMDFMQDQLADGRRIRVLTVLDVFSRECLALEVDTSLTGERVTRVLDRLVFLRDKPDRIGTDNGPEFRGIKMDQWAYKHDVALQFIPPGKPTKNAFIESFNSILRDDCLNQHWFSSLEDAKNKITAWKEVYNTIRPHGSLDRLTPEEYATAALLTQERVG
jgi:putative transposase